ncbi:MAG TPA: hypothetical protein P5211_06530, partial [Anaerolineae bacterium]|nr:hypothetical protein [Anaerolineae bacterium]
MNNLWRWLLLVVILAGCSGGPTSAPAATPTAPQTATPQPLSTETPPPTSTPLPPTAPSLAEVIAFEMRGAFDFFWEQANTEAGSPGYGLIRDRYPGSEGIASIA